MSRTWTMAGPRTAESEDGSVTFSGRSGLDVTYRGESLYVDSEMLASDMGIAVYFSTSAPARSEDADDVKQLLTEGLEFAGFRIEWY